MSIDDYVTYLYKNLMKFKYKIEYRHKIIFGKKVRFRKGFSLRIENEGRVAIGNRVFFNNYCSIAAMENIQIGDKVIIGENVKIYDHDHKFRDSKRNIHEQGYNTSPVIIGNNVWIASNVTILKGVIIGDNVVIGAGTVVYKSIPKNTLVINKQDLEFKVVPSEFSNSGGI